MTQGMDDYVTRRDFDAYRLETSETLAKMSQSQAVSAAKLERIPDDLRQLTAAVRSLEGATRTTGAPTELTQAVLGLHHVAEAIAKIAEKPQPMAEAVQYLSQKRGGISPGALFMSGMTACAIGLLLFHKYVGL